MRILLLRLGEVSHKGYDDLAEDGCSQIVPNRRLTKRISHYAHLSAWPQIKWFVFSFGSDTICEASFNIYRDFSTVPGNIPVKLLSTLVNRPETIGIRSVKIILCNNLIIHYLELLIDIWYSEYRFRTDFSQVLLLLRTHDAKNVTLPSVWLPMHTQILANSGDRNLIAVFYDSYLIYYTLPVLTITNSETLRVIFQCSHNVHTNFITGFH